MLVLERLELVALNPKPLNPEQRPQHDNYLSLDHTGSYSHSQPQDADMSYSLNSLKGGYIGDYIWDCYRGY